MGRTTRAACANRLAVVVLILVAAGCGGGGSDETVTYQAEAGLVGLRVTSGPLPPGEAGQPYPVVQLEATGNASGPLRWRTWSGALPAGLVLESDGRLRGTPQQRGFYVFGVHVTDGRLAGTTTLAVAVDTFGFYAHRGLVAGEAWSGRGVVLHAVGHAGPVTFAVVAGPSGPRLESANGAAGTVTYRPGSVGGAHTVDVIRATDPATGRSAELALTVRPDPRSGHVAAFGSSDVWYLNTDRKYGSHPYATDFQAALAAIGFRAPGSYDMVGSEADELAHLWIRLALLQRLNQLFLRQADGRAGSAGLAVSFPYSQPGPGYQKPAIGGWTGGAPHVYSEISLIDGHTSGVVGTAFVDDGINALHENNTTSGSGELGVFVNVLSNYFDLVYSHRALRQAPVTDADIPALRALINGLPFSGGRYAMLHAAGLDFAKIAATVAAHEIGHSLGLPHSPPQQIDHSIMAASANITPWAQPAFLSGDIAALRARLPGPGRYTGSRRPPTPSMPAGVCAGTRCHMRIGAWGLLVLTEADVPTIDERTRILGADPGREVDRDPQLNELVRVQARDPEAAVVGRESVR